jgi:hypothetical protein
MSLNST